MSDGVATVRAARRPIVGRNRVIRFLLKVWVPRFSGAQRRSPVTINGGPGWIIEDDERVYLAGSLDVADGQIAAIHLVLNPEDSWWRDESWPGSSSERA